VYNYCNDFTNSVDYISVDACFCNSLGGESMPVSKEAFLANDIPDHCRICETPVMDTTNHTDFFQCCDPCYMRMKMSIQKLLMDFDKIAHMRKPKMVHRGIADPVRAHQEGYFAGFRVIQDHIKYSYREMINIIIHSKSIIWEERYGKQSGHVDTISEEMEDEDYGAMLAGETV
jgi:hypothetical protein